MHTARLAAAVRLPAPRRVPCLVPLFVVLRQCGAGRLAGKDSVLGASQGDHSVSAAQQSSMAVACRRRLLVARQEERRRVGRGRLPAAPSLVASSVMLRAPIPFCTDMYHQLMSAGVIGRLAGSVRRQRRRRCVADTSLLAQLTRTHTVSGKVDFPCVTDLFYLSSCDLVGSGDRRRRCRQVP